MAKRVELSAENYRDAFHHMNNMIYDVVHNAWQLSLLGAFRWAVEAMGLAMELAPVYVGEPYTSKTGERHGGFLRASAYVKLEIDGAVVAESLAGNTQMSFVMPEGFSSARITVGFSAPYAFVQHEHIEFSHNEGEAKFLEKAIDRLLPRLETMVQDALEGY